MERKIGEIFEYNGEWYQCIEGYNCKDCDLRNRICHRDTEIFPFNRCAGAYREDKKSVIFKKLEKVGEPYKFQKRTIQTYKIYTEPFISFDMDFINTYLNGSDTIDIIIKQNIEDMEEKKLNLKPFDIQKAREGKPVCTRDGHKARIICFDRIDAKPILALVPSPDGKGEGVFDYFVSGQRFANALESDLDLMMLPEKKEGWINIIKTEDGGYCCKGEVHSDYNDAFSENINALDNRGITVKIEWEE